MTSHRYHPHEHDPQDAILFDDCERCEQHAENITSLDNENVKALLDSHFKPRTDTEWKALHTITKSINIVRNLEERGLR